MINLSTYRLNAAPTGSYSRRAVDLVRQSIVIDVLGPLKIEMGPEFYAKPLSTADAEAFRSSGITALAATAARSSTIRG